MAEVDNTPEEPKRETPAPVKGGASARGTIAQDADEITKGLDQALDGGSDPEKTRVKDIVEEMEKSMGKKPDDKTSGSEASSSMGDIQVVDNLGTVTDLKHSGPRSKRTSSAPSSPKPPLSRSETPPGAKRKHGGGLGERIAAKDIDSSSDNDWLVMRK